MCLPVSQILQFMEALVYVPAAEASIIPALSLATLHGSAASQTPGRDGQDGTEVFKEAPSYCVLVVHLPEECEQALGRLLYASSSK